MEADRRRPTPFGESAPDEELGIRVVSADEMEPANVIADIPGADIADADIADAGVPNDSSGGGVPSNQAT